MKRKILLTVETHQLLVISRTKGLTEGRCGECAGDVLLMRPEEAAALAGVSPRTIYAWVEAGRVHFMETAEEGLRICLDSLLNRMRV
jgi:excisionase family DNA binding protein